MSSDLIAIGFWEAEDTPEFVDPRLLVGEYNDLEEKERLVSYLESGKVFSSWMGYSYCRFECGVAGSLLGCTDLSDGRYVWPQGLSHYVEFHNVVLPTEFVAHAKSNNWQVDRDVELPKYQKLPCGGSRIPVDYMFWKSLYPKGRVSQFFAKRRQKSIRRKAKF